jgi:hypothetical protein
VVGSGEYGDEPLGSGATELVRMKENMMWKELKYYHILGMRKYNIAAGN